jgi:hypothetical protein
VSEVSTSTPTPMVRARPHNRAKRFALISSAACISTLMILSAQTKVGAQTTTTAAPTSTTIASASLALVMEPVTGNVGISLTAPNAMRTTVVITNETKVPLTNQQMVVRFGIKPDVINSVIDASGPVGLFDPITGAWFHTIAVIPPGERLSYTVNWFKFCSGKWPMAVRVGDRQISSTVQWSGTSSDARCPADETTNPQPPSFYALSWPSSISLTTATGVVVIPSSSTSSSTPPSTAPTTTLPASTTTTQVVATTTSTVRPTTTTSVTSSTLQSLSGPTTSSVTTTSTTTTKLGNAPTSSIAKPTTTISARPNGPTTTLFCKTIGGNKYCGPKSSAYKEGQAKAQELKPGQKPGQKPVVKSKSKPKPKPKTKKR